MKGSVGKLQIEWAKAPVGSSGETRVRFGGAGEWRVVRWKRDGQGVWVQFADRLVGYDVAGVRDDDGAWIAALRERHGPAEYEGLRFARAGELEAGAGAGAGRKGAKIKAQMPGKIVRVMVKVGDAVEKGQPLLVMEAMKMENEIRAPIAGKVVSLLVEPGQAVESGAELSVIE